MKRLALAFLLGIALLVGAAISSAQTFGSNWTGEYFNNASFSGTAATTRIDAAVNFTWGQASPIPGIIGADNFSVRWNSTQTFENGTYVFTVGRDDSVIVYLDGTPIITQTGGGPFQSFTATVPVTAGLHTLRVDFVEISGDAAVSLSWQLQGATGPTQTVGPSPTPGPTNTPAPTGLPSIPAGAITGTVIRASVLNVRDAPTVAGNRVGRVLRGQTYAIVGRDEDARWFLLQLSDRQGWALGYYLYINANEFRVPVVPVYGNVSGGPGLPAVTGVLAQTNATMRLRAEPDVNSAQIGRIGWGDVVPVTGRTSDGAWWQVIYKDTAGWVFAPYLTIIDGDISSVPTIR